MTQFHHMATVAATEVEMLGDFYEATGVSLGLLKQIESTCDWLGRLARQIAPLGHHAFALCQSIAASRVVAGKLLDPDDKAIDAIRTAIDSMENMLSMLAHKESFIDQDASLNGDHREFLHASYYAAIRAFGDAIEGGKALVDAVITHDLAAEPRVGKVYGNVDDMMRALAD